MKARANRRTVAMTRRTVWTNIQYGDKLSRQSRWKHRLPRWLRYVGGPARNLRRDHEQAKADRVGESLEPGGTAAQAVVVIESEVARGDGSAPGSTKRRANLTFEYGKPALCSESHLEAVI